MSQGFAKVYDPLPVEQWNPERQLDYQWGNSQVQLSDLNSASGWQQFISPETRVFTIRADLAEARDREVSEYRDALKRCFRMPDMWFSANLINANGYFGCEATRDETKSITGFNTWSMFETKFLREDMTYYWSKIKVFTRWSAVTKQTAIVLFEPTDDPSKNLIKPHSNELNDPFWVYSEILEEVTRLQEDSVWSIRDHVRRIEKEKTEDGKKPQPNYRNLHDIARHAIHVTESLDVAISNVAHIIRQHELYARLWTPTEDVPDIRHSASFQDISSRLSFFQSHIESIRHRSISNQKRLQNEIQLSFNIVSQHDTRLTVDISAAARSDSATMKTLAFVTLTFLPPTFISAIFSMSFFNYDQDGGWSMSNKIWIYWVFAIPITLATAIVWQYWHRFFPEDAGPRSNSTHVVKATRRQKSDLPSYELRSMSA
ncbi:hypothetical protein N7493_003742 [Penicillium malachiteum]|uniref:Mg2+ transporter protein, CorA-like/Zinc transport protein ZntB n=1 Tax=Penicillium malachiteum TaxID=1324776 RepID=A0AAD6MXY2_9EURO|nr:hypothetical protein N7493_003742 [Penicillium malachiteum]